MPIICSDWHYARQTESLKSLIRWSRRLHNLIPKSIYDRFKEMPEITNLSFYLGTFLSNCLNSKSLLNRLAGCQRKNVQGRIVLIHWKQICNFISLTLVRISFEFKRNRQTETEFICFVLKVLRTLTRSSSIQIILKYILILSLHCYDFIIIFLQITRIAKSRHWRFLCLCKIFL